VKAVPSILLLTFIIILICGCTESDSSKYQQQNTTIIDTPKDKTWSNEEMIMRFHITDQLTGDIIPGILVIITPLEGVNKGHQDIWSTNFNGVARVYVYPGMRVHYSIAFGSTDYVCIPGDITVDEKVTDLSFALERLPFK